MSLDEALEYRGWEPHQDPAGVDEALEVLAAAVERLEAGRVALFARLEVRDELRMFDKDMTTDELRGFFEGST